MKAQLLSKRKLCSPLLGLGLVLWVWIAMGAARAQTFRGSIVGTVQDQTQAPLPAATVTARNEATSLARTVQTDTSGNYAIPELPIGSYSVTVHREGFQDVTQPGVRVDVASERRVDFTLVPAKLAQTVEVRAEVPLVQSTTDVLGGTLEAPQVENLPVNGRDYTKLIFLNPGVAGSPDQITDSPGSFGEFSVNGARGRANNFLLDGTDMNDGYRNDPTINQAGVFGTPATILPVDAVAELAVLSNFAPEYGRNAGAVINIVTKSGTNQLHGTAAEYFRNSSLGARNFFDHGIDPATGQEVAKSPFHNHQFGGSLGGPIIRDRTFFFADYEGQRETGAQPSDACAPTAQDIAAASQGITVNPVIAALLARNPWGVAGCPVAVSTPFSNRLDSVIGKIDHNFNSSNLLTGRYYFGDSDQSFPLGLLGSGGVLPGYNTLTPTRINLVSLSYVRVISASLVNEARFGFNQFHETFFPQDRHFDPSSIGLVTGVGPQDFGLPDIRVSGFTRLGANDSLPRGRTDRNWQAIDDLSWKLNRHEAKFGFEFRSTPVRQFFDAGYRGRLKFASLSDFLQGIVSGGRQAEGNSNRHTVQNSYAGYAQDSFRVTRRLTLNYGVRWDYFGVIHEKNNLFSNFDPAVGLEQVGHPVLPPGVPDTPHIARLYQPDYNNFAPRLSFAYDVTGKGRTVVRGGWGVFYDVFSQDFFLGQLPFNTLNPGPAYNPTGPDPILFSFSPVGQIVSGQPVFPAASFGGSDVFAVDRHIRTPYMENYNFNVQQELGPKAVLQVGYVGSVGRKLFRYRDINQPTFATIDAQTSICDGCVPRPFDHGPFPPLGGTFFYVNYFESSAFSSYNSLQTSLRIRGFRGLESTVNYVYSHSIDNASDGQDFVANATQPNNSYRPDLEKGNSNFDLRHRFVWVLNYALPSRTGRWPRLVNGWGVSSVVTLQSGQPFHVNFSDDYDGTGEFFPRPDVVGDPFAGTHSPDAFLNLSAFAAPCTWAANPAGDGLADQCVPGTQHQGTMGRNSLIGPAFHQWDFSVYKDTALSERLKVQLRADFFNILNHPNFASPLYPGFEVEGDAPPGCVPAGHCGFVDPQTGRTTGFFSLTQTGDVGVGNPFLGGGGPRGIQLAVKFVF
jgi:hypothetical protein